MTGRRAELERLRDVLWASIEAADAEKRAPLAAQFRATLAELDELQGDTGKGDPLDEIAARRAARGGEASGSGRSAV